MNDNSSLDPSVLETLRELDGTGSVLEQVISAVLEVLPGAYAEIQSAAEANDTERLRKVAHGLKSSAGSVGALGLAEVLRDLEHAALESDAETIRARIVALQVAVPAVSTALDAARDCVSRNA